MKYRKWDDFKVGCGSIQDVMSRPKNHTNLTVNERNKLDKLLSKENKSAEDLDKIGELNKKIERYINPPLSEACKKYLLSRYAPIKYDTARLSVFQKRPCVQKGIDLEQNGIDLVSSVTKVKYKRPKDYSENEYLVGLCDAISTDGSTILEIKTSWSAASFMEARRLDKLAPNHFAQMQGYLNLYNISKGIICFTLVNTPPHLIEQEINSLERKYMMGEIQSDKYETELQKLENLFDFRNIPKSKRIVTYEVERSDEYMDALIKKVNMCREFLNEFEKKFMRNKKILTSFKDYLSVGTEEEDNT